MSDNIIPLRPEFPLFNDKVRRNMAERLKGSVPENTEAATVDRLEEVLCAEIMRFFRAVFVKLAERAGDTLGKKIVGP